MASMTPKEKTDWAVARLREMAQKQGRAPVKADFDPATRARIKAFLGPWPRALETAGLKEPKKKEQEKMEEKLLQLAREEGFYAAIIPTKDVPTNADFRRYCEENLCGQYGANYSCPPDCGTPKEMHDKILAQDRALVISTIWDVKSYDDKPAVLHAKREHNQSVLRLTEKVRALGVDGFCTGYNGCHLCEPCLRQSALPCPHPEKRISCMSAYCIDVAKLAERCQLEFGWVPNKLYLFGMIAYHEEKK